MTRATRMTIPTTAHEGAATDKPAAAHAVSPAAVTRAGVVHAMTIPFTMQIRCREDDHGKAADRADALIERTMPALKAYLDHVEAVFSPFRADSAVSLANRADWSALLDDPDFAEVYALCALAKRITDGHFDAAHAGGYDPVGIVKGWAVQRAHERLLMPLVRSGACEAAAIGGGGDVQTAVADGSDFVWRVGVQDPADPDATVRTIMLRDGAVATSGTSKRGEHIDRTAHDLAQATVVDDHLTFADMWATTAIAAGETEFRRLFGARGSAQSMAVLVRVDGSVTSVGGSAGTDPSDGRA